MATEPSHALKLRVKEAAQRDVGRGIVRIDPELMKQLELRTGDIVLMRGEKETVAKALPAAPEQRGEPFIYVDGITRQNAGAPLDLELHVEKIDAAAADAIWLTPCSVKPRPQDLAYLGRNLNGHPVRAGDRLRVKLFGQRSHEFIVDRVQPDDVVVVDTHTSLHLNEPKQTKTKTIASYEDIGGLKSEVLRIREMIELPLRFPEVFERLGVDAPKGVLLHGPPGCGKTLIARTIAHETDANFFSVSGPEIIHKFYGESEAHLRKIFDEAAKQAPSIIFLDEVDAIAPKREAASGDVERRVVAQLLALMDGLNRRANIVVIAATNLPNAIDPALRRPGRFDREIAIAIPDLEGRKDVLAIHTRNMPLADEVDLHALASMTHGFVGADLEALCREAALLSLRSVLADIDFRSANLPYDKLTELQVTLEHFQTALHSVSPSAIREVIVEVPDTKWEDIGGLDDAKRFLQEAIEWPLVYGELFRTAGVRPSKGLLLAGPPGCGKTMLAKAVASETQVNFISVKGPELLSKFVGDSEKAVRDIFQKARQAAPCVLFFDEIDGLVGNRDRAGNDSQVSERLLSQFLSEFDGVEDLKDVFVLAATNRADLIDPALKRPGRLGQTLQIGLPDETTRRSILEVHFRNRPLADDVKLETLVEQTAGLSGAELAAVVDIAARDAIRRSVLQISPGDQEAMEQATEALRITAADMDHALHVTRQQKEFLP